MATVALISIYEANYLGVRVLSSFLKSQGHSAPLVFFKDHRWENRDTPLETHIGYQCFTNFEIVTLEYENKLWSEKEASLFQKRLKELKPDIIGISARSPIAGFAEKLAHYAKDACNDILLVAGGYGPSLDPAQFLSFGFDAVLMGDGEEALLELANCVSEKQNWKNIKNLAYLDNGEVTINAMRPQTKDISIYPPPAYGDAISSFIDHDTLYRNCDPVGTKGLQSNMKGVYSTYITRGCVNHCSYCSGGYWASLYKKDCRKSFKTRKRNLDDVLDELAAIDKTKFSYVYFVDECNTLTTDEARWFYAEYGKRVGLPFTAYVNYNKILDHPDLLKLMTANGFDSTGVGIQTGSEKFAADIYLRKNRNQTYVDLLKLLDQALVTTKIQLIGGNCYEDEDTFDETLKLIQKLPYDPLDPLRLSLVIFRLKVFPNAPLIEFAPKVVSEPMPANEWWRRALIMDMRRFADDDEMEFAISNEQFRKNPILLKDFALEKLVRVRMETMEKKLEASNGRALVVFGAGKQMNQNVEFFRERGFNPKAILVDEKYLSSLPVSMHGIPLSSPERMGDDLKASTVAVLATQTGAIGRKLISRYGVDRENLILCSTKVA